MFMVNSCISYSQYNTEKNRKGCMQDNRLVDGMAPSFMPGASI